MSDEIDKGVKRAIDDHNRFKSEFVDMNDDTINALLYLRMNYWFLYVTYARSLRYHYDIPEKIVSYIKDIYPEADNVILLSKLRNRGIFTQGIYFGFIYLMYIMIGLPIIVGMAYYCDTPYVEAILVGVCFSLVFIIPSYIHTLVRGDVLYGSPSKFVKILYKLIYSRYNHG